MSILPTFRNIFYNLSSKINLNQATYLHTTAVAQKYPCHRMKRDIKVRETVKKYWFERLSINAMRKAAILPRELTDICDEQMNSYELKASLVKIRKRCMVTSRPRGVVNRWRLSRIVWRNEVDYNKISGVQRAMW